jgi:hypothetical protein
MIGPFKDGVLDSRLGKIATEGGTGWPSANDDNLFGI